MGLTYTEVELLRADDLALARPGYMSAEQVHRMRGLALVDNGAAMLTRSRSLSHLLKLAKVIAPQPRESQSGPDTFAIALASKWGRFERIFSH